MMARSFYYFCAHRGYKFWGMGDSHEDSYIDEVLSYVFAALGFYFQYKIGFDVPFPFNLLLLPLGTLLAALLSAYRNKLSSQNILSFSRTR